jgi:hypothetical protein
MYRPLSGGTYKNNDLFIMINKLQTNISVGITDKMNTFEEYQP